MTEGLNHRERETAEKVGRVARRAIRRLDILEWVAFMAAIAAAVLGGAGVAWLLAAPGSIAFRVTWFATSLLLFVVPGGIVILQMRRAERAGRDDRVEHGKSDDG
jgi:hypothetical protein